MPRMDRSGYFVYATSTAKKKKISLMQPPPPREAFVEGKSARRPGSAQRVGPSGVPSVGSASARVAHPPEMSRGARLHSQVSQLESYQPRYHTIREAPVERKVHPQDCDGRVRSNRKGRSESSSPREREYQSPNFRWVETLGKLFVGGYFAREFRDLVQNVFFMSTKFVDCSL